MGLWNWFIQKKQKEEIIISDPEELGKGIRTYSTKFNFLRNRYSFQEIDKLGMKDRTGRVVGAWRLIKSADDALGDIFIPLYKYKRTLAHRKYSKPIKRWYARSNRRHPTKAEAIMWEELRRN